MEILYSDADILVCVKPARVLSTDEPGGLPELVRQALGDEKADVWDFFDFPIIFSEGMPR